MTIYEKGFSSWLIPERKDERPVIADGIQTYNISAIEMITYRSTSTMTRRIDGHQVELKRYHIFKTNHIKYRKIQVMCNDMKPVHNAMLTDSIIKIMIALKTEAREGIPRETKYDNSLYTDAPRA